MDLHWTELVLGSPDRGYQLMNLPPKSVLATGQKTTPSSRIAREYCSMLVKLWS